MVLNKDNPSVLLELFNLSETHWGEVIIEAHTKNKFPVLAADDAQSWVTCACGSLDPSLRNGSKAPEDMLLQRLGRSFYTAVSLKQLQR